MYRTPLARISRSAAPNVARRTYAATTGGNPVPPEVQPKTGHTTDTPPRADGIKTPKTNPSGGNGPLIAAVVAVAAGAGYWYSTTSESHGEAAKGHAKAAKNEAEAGGKAAKDHLEAAGREAKAQAQREYDARTSQVQHAANDAARSVKEGAQARYDAARSGTVQTYEDAKATAHQKVEDAKKAAEQAKEKAESTASSWWSWGSKKTDEKKSQVAGKVEEGADKVKAEARKRE
ncbi:hypothetical protein M407DRAFT_243152 [Tulasnella calospora MUT 4182]|uniref:Uncharacterized protein n=1 Tax=Tulasnella calospora MUT 4182 TaxID=1051891 RepID=A0A0C3QKT3_9AGAM|nr:hypothetical protein M407DRAFT_243152 [Tulasnella calospora MUT 4182]